MPSLYTSTTIAAPPSVVRKVFLDFPSYPEWNPFITCLESPTPSPEPGTTLRFVADGRVSKPLLVDNTPERFSWIGIMVASWVFRGHHFFEFEPFGDVGANGETESCKFVQREDFSGIAAGLLLMILGGKVETLFKDMNVALKARVEEQRAEATEAVEQQ